MKAKHGIGLLCTCVIGLYSAGCGGTAPDNSVNLNDNTDADANANTNESQPSPPQERVQYRVTFETSWSADSHPTEFPGGAHFSPPIGGTHNDQVRFWQVGALASPGIQRMAELGAASPLREEINAEIDAGNAGEIFVGGSLNALPAVEAILFEASADFPLVTLVSMIAPSPDWFVGVSGLILVDNGQWLDEVVVDLIAYDAGTDSGQTYTATNAATQPAVPIQILEQGPVLVDGQMVPLGTFRFQLLDTVHGGF